jgi:hypothetical protein
MIINVEIYGRQAGNSNTNGIVAIGGVVGTTKATVQWPGVWEDTEAQRAQLLALFPDVDPISLKVTA